MVLKCKIVKLVYPRYFGFVTLKNLNFVYKVLQETIPELDRINNSKEFIPKNMYKIRKEAEN